MPASASTSSPAVLQCGSHRLPLGARTYVMGIINLTPDSFSGDGLAGNVEGAVAQAREMVAAGADILDIGGESSRPGAQPASTQEELQRVLPVLRAVAAEVHVPLSVDTWKAEVAAAALEAGAAMINDITALTGDPAMVEVCRSSDCGVVLMHMQGTPSTMQQHPQYENVVTEVRDYLRQRAEAAVAAGIDQRRIVIDPGFGFGKTVEHNLELVDRLDAFCELGLPVLIGLSRKSTIGHVLDLPVDQRLEGGAAATAIAIDRGADMIRVHDVRAMVRVARMTDAIVRSSRS